MIVVAVIGVLASIAIPSYQSYRRKAWQAEAKSSLTHIYTAEQNFYSQWGVYIGALHPAGTMFSGDYRYAVGFGGVNVYGFCGAMNVIGIARPQTAADATPYWGPRGMVNYTGLMNCATATNISNLNRESLCNCTDREAMCQFIGVVYKPIYDQNHSPFFRSSPGATRIPFILDEHGSRVPDPDNPPIDLSSPLILSGDKRKEVVSTQVTCHSFGAAAVSNLKGNRKYESLDIWGITHKKRLKHVKSGL